MIYMVYKLAISAGVEVIVNQLFALAIAQLVDSIFKSS